MDRMNVAIVGCGDISHAYASTIKRYPDLNLKGVWNRTSQKARALADEFKVQVYPNLENLLADPEIDVVVNLTTQAIHAQIVRQCLLAGKHVHTEKPLALTWQEASSLAELAHKRGLRLSVCPINFMGDAQQTLYKALSEGSAGRIKAVYAEVNWHRLETWHPNPEPFYQIGSHYDVAVYPLRIINAFLGPAVRVQAWGRVLLPERTNMAGEKFSIHTPDFIVAMIELACGAVVRLTSNFYVSWKTKQRGIEFHGDKGSLFLSCWESFDASVEYAVFGEDYHILPYIKEPYQGIDWGLALKELFDAINQNRPHLPSAEMAVHEIEILNAIDRSIQERVPVDLHSTFLPPKPLVSA